MDDFSKLVKQIITDLDRDKNGRLSLHEIIDTVADPKYKEELRALFKKHDANKDDVIDAQELRKWLEDVSKKP
ncbi:hypothetical protein D915_004833 [Fasciola hepatica]|uniref:EF-hand domain-containing protein n=1 Tax=Fasciola hepatica TaxID=6192 RepID=A0A4E0RDJ9_FASHE|nr:hypothetical protein D915_004833 [Fasciola hepatica]